MNYEQIHFLGLGVRVWMAIPLFAVSSYHRQYINGQSTDFIDEFGTGFKQNSNFEISLGPGRDLKPRTLSIQSRMLTTRLLQCFIAFYSKLVPLIFKSTINRSVCGILNYYYLRSGRTYIYNKPTYMSCPRYYNAYDVWAHKTLLQLSCITGMANLLLARVPENRK